MPGLTDLTGLAGAAIVIVALVVAAGRTSGLRRSRLAILAAVSAIASLVPMGALPMTGYLRGLVGDLSVTTLVLLLLGLHQSLRGRSRLDSRSTLALQLLAAVGGMALYPLTLGIGAWDPYRLGYGDAWFVVALLVIALSALFLDLTLVAFCISAGVLAWGLGAYESRNLWDYLLDPLLFAWGLGVVLLRGARALARRHRGAGAETIRTRAESSR